MELSRFENLAMKSFVRAWVMHKVDAPILFRGLDPGQFGRVLEVGCGHGYGTINILKTLQPKQLVSTDYDPHMVRSAQRYVQRRWDGPTRVTFRQADATRLPFEDEEFDAVICFAVLHHIQQYRQAVEEIARVLKPGGTYLLEEVTAGVHFWPVNKLMPAEVLFRESDVPNVLREHGFSVRWKGKYLRAYLFFECQKTADSPSGSHRLPAPGG